MSKADMAEDTSYGCSSKPRKKSNHHLQDYPKKTPRVLIVGYSLNDNHV
jgi:hypothetical protein